MNTRIKLFNIFIATVLNMMLLVACSNDDRTDNNEQINADGTYTYNMRMDCMITDSATDVTRANYSWESGATLYLRFKSGSNYIAGTAVYNRSTGLWELTTTSSLSTTTSESVCEAYFFKNPKSITAAAINMDENTACYQGTGSYTRPSSTEIYASVMLKPKTWRLRFCGRSNSSITILSNSSDISYYTSFNRNTGEFGSTKKDVTLNVSTGSYSPYIYGFFASPSSSNIISIKNNTDSKQFYRNINGSTLQSKGSGWLYAPSASNYSGWTLKTYLISNCDLKTSYPVAFTDRLMTQWSIGSNVSVYTTKIYKASEISSLTNEQLTEKFLKEIDNFSTAGNTENIISTFYGLDSSTKYVLLTYCYGSGDDHGNLVKYEFTTLSTSAPKAEIVDAKYNNTQYMCYVSARNGASSYYLVSSQTYEWHSWSEYKVAYIVRREIAKGNISNTYNTWSPSYIWWSKTNNYITFCTWARNSYGTIGNYNVFQGHINSRRFTDEKKQNNGTYNYYTEPIPLVPQITIGNVCVVE